MTPINERHVLIAGGGDRTQSSSSTALFVVADSNSFYKKTDGSFSPNVIHIKATLLMADGPVTFSAQGCVLSSVTEFTCEVVAESVSATIAVVTATAANNGNPIAQSVLLGVVSDGVAGEGSDGARGAGQYYASGTQWSDEVARLATPGGHPVLGDVVTITNGTSYALTKRWNGTVWNPQGAVYDGSLFVTATIGAAALNVQQLRAVSAVIGSFSTGGTGARTDFNDFGTKIYSETGALRVTVGKKGS